MKPATPTAPIRQHGHHTDSRLGRKSICFYGACVIGFLRFVGMLNAAVWLGAALFFMAGVTPALMSRDVHALFPKQYSDYYSDAVNQVMATRYFYWHTVCAIVALLHALTEWLYLGRSAHRRWLGLLAGLLAVGLIANAWLIPKLAQLHLTRHAVSPAQREAAAQSFRSWNRAFQGLHLLVIGGVAVYFWRATSPSDPLRFVTPTKFRS
jgi:hypothetical protein